MAAALLPCHIQLFPKHRWVNAIGPLGQNALLCSVHRVGIRAGLLWLTGTAAPTIALALPRAPSSSSRRQAWAVDSDGEEDVSGKQLVPFTGDPAMAAAGEDRPTMTGDGGVDCRQQKRKAAACLRLPCIQDRFLAGAAAMELGVVFLRVVEYIASDRWQVATWRKCSEGTYNSRVVAACNGALTDAVHDTVDNFERSASWQMLRPSGATAGLASRCFSVIYANACALTQLCLALCAGFPWVMWRLVAEPTVALATWIIGVPECMLDEWSRMFLKKYNTVSALLSARVRAILVAMAVFIRFEICRIECRHNAIRRCVVANDTNAPTLRLLSAKHMLRRVVALGHFLDRKLTATAKKKKRTGPKYVTQKRNRYNKPFVRRAGGGGGMRSFVSNFLQGKRYKKKADRQKVFKAAHDAYKEFSSAEGDIAQYNIAQNRSVGIAGTESYRHCGDGFGCKRQRSGQACVVGKRRRLRVLNVNEHRVYHRRRLQRVILGNH